MIFTQRRTVQCNLLFCEVQLTYYIARTFIHTVLWIIPWYISGEDTIFSVNFNVSYNIYLTSFLWPSKVSQPMAISLVDLLGSDDACPGARVHVGTVLLGVLERARDRKGGRVKNVTLKVARNNEILKRFCFTWYNSFTLEIFDNRFLYLLASSICGFIP